MTEPRTWVRLDWEAGGTAFLAISRPDQPVERIPLSTSQVARLLADGAYLWSVIEPRRQGLDHMMVAPDRPAGASKVADSPPHFIGAWGE